MVKILSIIIFITSYFIPICYFCGSELNILGFEMAKNTLTNFPDRILDDSTFFFLLSWIANLSGVVLILSLYHKSYKKIILVIGILGFISALLWFGYSVLFIYLEGEIYLFPGTTLWTIGMLIMTIVYYRKKDNVPKNFHFLNKMIENFGK